MIRTLIVLGLAAAAFASVPAQETPSDPLSKLKFLAGAWKGELNGELVEEHWTEPAGDAILGMFRWVSKEGKTRLFELLSIKAEAEGPVLRLRHFDGSFTPWASEASGAPTLKMTECAEGRVVFTSSAAGGLKACEYVVRDNQLTILVSFQEAGRQPLRFQMKRQR